MVYNIQYHIPKIFSIPEICQKISDVLVVVVRYYGGTKLGFAGLIKAYKETAKIVLNETKIITKILECTIKLEFSFSDQHLIFTLLNKFDAKIIEFKTEKNCNIFASLPREKIKNISEKLSEMPQITFEIL